MKNKIRSKSRKTSGFMIASIAVVVLMAFSVAAQFGGSASEGGSVSVPFFGEGSTMVIEDEAEEAVTTESGGGVGGGEAVPTPAGGGGEATTVETEEVPPSAGGGVGGGPAISGITTIPIMPIMELLIVPQSQVTNDGTAIYKVVIKDPHKVPLCPESDEGSICPAIYPAYKYKLSFEGDRGVTGSFEEDSILLGAGESRSVELKVKAEKRGASKFKVYAISDGAGARVIKMMGMGVIVYGKKPIPIPIKGAFFVGKGFILNEDETRGALVDLKILKKDSVLSGKATIGHYTFRLDGKVMEIVSPTTGEVYLGSYTGIEFKLTHVGSGKHAGTFTGSVKNLGSFLLLRGAFTDFKENEWTLTATGKKAGVIREIIIDPSVDEEKPVSVEEFNLEEAIVLKPKPTKPEPEEKAKVIDEVYIRPIEIKKKRFLGIIPFGKAIKVEVVKGEEVSEKTISENSKKVIEGYKISVGSLEDEDNIELEVEKA